MNRRSDLFSALSVALVLHAMAYACASSLFTDWLSTRQDVTPVFIEGFSSVECTVVTPTEEPSEEQPVPVAVPEEYPEPPVPPEAIVSQPIEAPAPAEESPVALQNNDLVLPTEVVQQPPQADTPQLPVDGNPLPKGVDESIIGLGEIRPKYPLGSRLRGEEGVVAVDVLVDRNGRAKTIDISQTSGFPALDRAAREAVLKARFVAKDGGAMLGGHVPLSFRFKLVDQ